MQPNLSVEPVPVSDVEDTWNQERSLKDLQAFIEYRLADVTLESEVI